MTKKAAPKAEETKPQRRGMFDRFAALDHGGGDLVNFELALGSNKCRVLTTPIMVRKHWDLPASADAKGAVPCRKFISEEMMDDYAKAVEEDREEEFLDALPHCEYCEWAKEHPGFYTLKEHWVFVLVQDGIVKVGDVYQPSILRALNSFEKDEDWVDSMPNGLLSDIEINIKKESTGPKAQNVKYSVTGVPKTEPLAPEELAAYMKQAPDLIALKTPPSPDTDEGREKWAELLKKAGKPKEGEKPKGFGNN